MIHAVSFCSPLRRHAATVLVLGLSVAIPGCVNTPEGPTPASTIERQEAIAGERTAAAPPAERPFANDAELLAAVIAKIEPFEGRRHRVYTDSRGHLTIGVGFNLDRPGAADDLQRLLPGVNVRALRRGSTRLTDAQIDRLLEHDAARALAEARRCFDNFDSLPRTAQLILVDMTFNLGSLRRWPNLRAAVAAHDFSAAADAMHDSRWRTQTGRRARHLIAQMHALAPTPAT
jgi:GH24 family phage-related lysozyme (muramidase)